MCRTVTSDPQKTSGCGSWLGRYLADQGDGAVVSNMKGQELAEVGTCGDQKGGEDVPGSEKASNKLLVDLDGMSSINSHCVLLHLKFSHAPTGAPTKCGYYICYAARFPKVPTPSAAPAGLATLFVFRGREVASRQSSRWFPCFLPSLTLMYSLLW